MPITLTTEENQFLQNILVDFTNTQVMASSQEAAMVKDIQAKLVADQPTETP